MDKNAKIKKILIIPGIIIVSILAFIFASINLAPGSEVGTNTTYENNFTRLNLTDGSLKVYWSFDEQNNLSNITYDYSNNSIDGTITNGLEWISDRGYYNSGGYNFTGQNYTPNGWRRITTNSYPINNNMSAWSFSIWLKRGNVTNGDGNFSRPLTLFGYNGWMSVYNTGSCGVNIHYQNTTGNHKDAGISTPCPYDEWFNFVFVFFNDTTSSFNTTIYLNGVYKTSNRITNVNTSLYDGGSILPYDARPLSIGAEGSQNGIILANQYNGSIDEFMAFSKALTYNDVQQIYNATYPRFLPTGEMYFSNKNFSTNNLVNLFFPSCQMNNGSFLQAKINNGAYQNVSSTCSINNYQLVGTGNLTNANITVKLNSNPFSFYSPIVFGNISLNDFTQQTNITFESPTPNNNSNVGKTTQTIVANITDNTNLNTSSWIDFDRSLVGYWSMDYCNATGCFDNSSYGNFGKFINASYSNITYGIRGNDLDFDGTGYAINVSSIGNLQSQGTISMFVLAGQNSSCTGCAAYFFDTDGANRYLFYKQDTPDIHGIYLGGSSVYSGNALTYVEGEIFLLTITYDTVNDVHRIYKNGVSIINLTNGINTGISGNIIIGNRYSLNQAHVGSIDEVKVWNRTLSVSEVLADYNSRLNKLNASFSSLTNGYHNYTISAIDELGYFNQTSRNFFVDLIPPTITFQSPTPTNSSTVGRNQTIVANITDNLNLNTSSFIDFDRSLVGYWSMDYYNATGVFDNSSYGSFGVFNSKSTTSNITSGIRGNAITMDNNSQVINLSSPVNLNITGDITILTWVYHVQNSSDQKIFTKGRGDGGTNSGYKVGIFTNNLIEGEIGSSSATCVNRGVAGGTIININQWYLVGFTKNSTHISSIVNGNIERPLVCAVSIGITANSAYIGKSYSTTQYSWNGSIDEVMIFNRSLSQEELKAIYSSQINDVNTSFTNLANGTHTYKVYAMDELGNLNISTQNFNTDALVNISNINWMTTGGLTTTAYYNQIMDYINVSVVDNNNVTVYMNLINPDGTVVVNNATLVNFSVGVYSYMTNVNLNRAGNWTIQINATDQFGNQNTSSQIFNVEINSLSIIDGWYGYSAHKILTTAEISSLLQYGYDLFELQDNITLMRTNFATMLTSINDSINSNVRVGLNYLLDFDYNSSTPKINYTTMILQNFTTLNTAPYSDGIAYISLELVNASQYNDSTKSSILNNFSATIISATNNEFPIYSKNYNNSLLDSAYIKFTDLLYFNSSNEQNYIQDQKVTLKTNTTLNRIYEGIVNIVKTIAKIFHTNIIDKLRGTPDITVNINENVSVLSNDDIVIFNNQSSAKNLTVDVSSLGVTGKDAWDSTEGKIIEMNNDGSITVEVRGYNASIIYFDDLDHIQMDTLNSGTLYKGGSSTLLLSNHTNGVLDSNFGIGGAYDIQIEIPDPNYVHGNFMTDYGWINASISNYSGIVPYSVVIFADKNNEEIDRFNYTNTEFYAYISVADYNNTDVWNTVKEREVDAWLALNGSINIFLDGLDYATTGEGFSTRMKTLVDYAQITKARKVILNTYTAYDDFATWGLGGAMKESCVNRWNGISAGTPSSYTRENWTLELQKSDWYNSHNIPIYCQAFNNRTTDGSNTILNYTELQNIYFASKVLGYDYFYLSQPDFNYAHEEYVYNVGSDLDRTYHTLTSDPNTYYRTYSNGIVYYNSTSGNGWIEDGKVMNNITACFYLYNPAVQGATWNFNVNKRDPVGSSAEYSFDKDWSVGVWKWKCADITSETPINGMYLIEAWVGSHTTTVGQGFNIGNSFDLTTGKHSFYDTSTTDSFTPYETGRNWMINISVNQSNKISLDTTDKITQTEVNSSIVGRNRNVTLSSTSSFPIEVWSKPTLFNNFKNVSFLNSTNQWVVLNYVNNSDCDSGNPTWASTTIESLTFKACIENSGTDTLVRVSSPSLSSRIFMIENADESAPIINIQSPINLTYYNTSTIWFNATVDETISSWTVNYNGTNTTLPAINTTLTVEDGSFNLKLYANDTLLYVGVNQSINFTVDTTFPVINITFPVNSTYTVNFTTLNYTLNEINKDKCWFSNNSGVNNYSFQNGGINFTGLKNLENENNWTIFCNDSAGNQNSTVVYFLVDTIFPKISMVAPVNNYQIIDFVSGNVPVAVNFSLTDRNNNTCIYNLTGPLNMSYSVDCNNGYNNFTFNINQSGTYHLNITTNDISGNVNSTVINFSVLAYDEARTSNPTSGPGDSDSTKPTSNLSEFDESFNRVYNRTFVCNEVKLFLYAYTNNYTDEQFEKFRNDLGVKMGVGIGRDTLKTVITNFNTFCNIQYPLNVDPVKEEEDKDEVNILAIIGVIFGVFVIIMLISFANTGRRMSRSFQWMALHANKK